MSTTDGKSRGRNGTRLRSLPSVDRVLAESVLVQARAELPHSLLADAVRAELADERVAILNGIEPAESRGAEEIAARAAERAWLLAAPSLRPVINAIGVS